MYDWDDVVPGVGNFSSFASSVLDYYVNEQGSIGYNLQHGIRMPFDRAPGDKIGLFPEAYLRRAMRPDGGGLAGSDGKLSLAALNDYVLPFPYQLKDGTLARTVGWKGEPSGDLTLWGDDQFMGLTLAARAARAGAANRSAYLGFVVAQSLSFAARMADRGSAFPAPAGTGDGLFFHGVDATTGQPSCCKWGRANGWGMMSHAEVMAAVDDVAPSHPNRSDVLRVFTDHALAMARFQAPSGMWRQLVNDSTQWEETSVTAMTTYAIATGVRRGWLDSGTFLPVVRRAWPALAATVQANGTVTGICSGTGIGMTTGFYRDRPTSFMASQPGLGAVWRAARAVFLLNQGGDGGSAAGAAT